MNLVTIRPLALSDLALPTSNSPYTDEKLDLQTTTICYSI